MMEKEYKAGFSLLGVIALLGVVCIIVLVGYRYKDNVDLDDERDILLSIDKWRQKIEAEEQDDLDIANKKINSASTTVSRGSFEDYDIDKLPNYADRRIILFFFAAWSEFSRDLALDIETNRDQIPLDVIILKTDFDRRLSLKTKYGVLKENTFVQIDENGQLVKKWVDSKNLEEIILELKS